MAYAEQQGAGKNWLRHLEVLAFLDLNMKSAEQKGPTNHPFNKVFMLSRAATFIKMPANRNKRNSSQI